MGTKMDRNAKDKSRKGMKDQPRGGQQAMKRDPDMERDEEMLADGDMPTERRNRGGKNRDRLG
ncbi:hypothetical protein ACFYTQ_30535 [Nocardia sp. NPDC004068]|uniref:hypothetical protein n=1 Tax=Nocardia sp. NPDC004068 TaxID=3364303 RepID=UPI00369EB8FB